MSTNGHNDTPVVHMEGIVKRFGTITALDGVDFTVEKQQVMTLLGDNGAGKSTLIKILTGVYPLTRGQIHFEGQPVRIDSPREARALGIAEPIQLQTSRLMGDARPSRRARGQVEAPLLELGDELPILIGSGAFGQGFERELAAGIVGERPAVEFFGSLGILERPVEETGQVHQGGRSIRPPQVLDGALESPRRRGRIPSSSRARASPSRAST